MASARKRTADATFSSTRRSCSTMALIQRLAKRTWCTSSARIPSSTSAVSASPTSRTAGARLPTTSIAPASKVRFWVARRPARLSSAQVMLHSKVEMGNSPLCPPELAQPALEDRHVARLVPALPGELQPQLPGRVGELGQALGRDVEAGDLVAHVAVHGLPQGPRVGPVVLVHLGVPEDHVEAGVAGRRLAQREVPEAGSGRFFMRRPPRPSPPRTRAGAQPRGRRNGQPQLAAQPVGLFALPPQRRRGCAR